MLEPIEFLKMLGWTDWVNKYLVNEFGEDWTFADLVFDTLPNVLQLFFVVFLLNWVMGIIADSCKIIGGRRGGL